MKWYPLNKSLISFFNKNYYIHLWYYESIYGNTMIKLILSDNTTMCVCAIILVVLIYCIAQTWKIYTLGTKIKKINYSSDWEEELKKDRVLMKIYSRYKTTTIFEDNKGNKKTDEDSVGYFKLSLLLDVAKINQRALAASSGVLVGLGLLGTFLGLTIGISNFESTSTEAIQESINSLLGGMGTAFITSLIGMGTSTFLIVIEKFIVNRLYRNLQELCEQINMRYYISTPEKYAIIYERQNETLSTQYESMISLLTSTDNQGNKLTMGNLMRDIYTESKQQTSALAGFTEELFFEVANNAMNESLRPLVAEVQNVTNTLSLKLEQFAESVASPADNMASGIVNDLRVAIGEMLEELRINVTALTTGRMDSLNSQLETAVNALSLFPTQIETMTSNMAANFANINEVVQNMANSSSAVSEGTIRTMREQIDSVAESMQIAVQKVEDVVSEISNRSSEASLEIINQMRSQIEYSTTNMNNLVSSVENTVNNLRTQLQSQTDLSASRMAELAASLENTLVNLNNRTVETNNSIIQRQTESNLQSENMLASFKEAINEMEVMLEGVTNTVTQFTRLQQETNITATNMNELSRNATTATNNLKVAQTEFVSEYRDTVAANIQTIDAMNTALSTARTLPNEYVMKFAEIRSSLSSIFEEINRGLNQYTATVRSGTEELLGTYTSSMNEALRQLASSVEELGEVLEDLKDVNVAPHRRY